MIPVKQKYGLNISENCKTKVSFQGRSGLVVASGIYRSYDSPTLLASPDAHAGSLLALQVHENKELTAICDELISRVGGK